MGYRNDLLNASKWLSTTASDLESVVDNQLSDFIYDHGLDDEIISDINDYISEVFDLVEDIESVYYDMGDDNDTWHEDYIDEDYYCHRHYDDDDDDEDDD